MLLKTWDGLANHRIATVELVSVACDLASSISDVLSLKRLQAQL